MYLGVVPDVLPLAPRPLHGELRSSWLIRVASANALTLRELIDAVAGRHPGAGIDRAFLDDHLPHGVATALAHFARLPDASVRGLDLTRALPHCPACWMLRAPALQGDGYDRVADQRAEYAFCPSCLIGAAPVPGPPYIPVQWACAVVTHCPSHHIRLLERCPTCFAGDPFLIGVGDHPERAECWRCEGPLGLSAWPADRSVGVEVVLHLQSALIRSLRGQPSARDAIDLPALHVVADLLDLLVDDEDGEPPYARVAAVHWPNELRIVGHQIPESRLAYLPVRVRFMALACVAAVIVEAGTVTDQQLESARRTLAVSLADHEWRRWEQHIAQWPPHMRQRLTTARQG